ncbi:TonB family protein [Candidatus Sulfopaludibacter sp. SbA4]|nr:TonB family protein [Candidatus Sulfopaludibacter sp. SbA4]
MTAHVDILDQPERLSRPFVGSLVLHVSIAAALLSYTWVANRTPANWGDANGGGMGSVAVNTVASIKLPPKNGPTNPVASDTESLAPEAPAKKKVQPKAKAPDPDAIPIKSRNARKRAMEAAVSPPNRWRDQQKDAPNQVYSSGQAVSSPMYNIPGGGGVGLGSDSPLGTQFGYYAKLLRDQVASKWRTGDIDPRITSAPQAAVTFTLLRNGSLAPGSVKVSQSSGNAALDLSAQRAILDAAPFPPLPPQYAQNQAVLELRFELRR